jgi:hypothetical protein
MTKQALCWLDVVEVSLTLLGKKFVSVSRFCNPALEELSEGTTPAYWKGPCTASRHHLLPAQHGKAPAVFGGSLPQTSLLFRERHMTSVRCPGFHFGRKWLEKPEQEDSILRMVVSGS